MPKKNQAAPKIPPVSRKLFPAPLVSALVAGAAVRIFYLVSSQASPYFLPALLDPKYYHGWAMRILSGDFGHGVFYGLPLYPFFLATLYKFTGLSVFAVKAIQGVLGLFTIFFVYKTAEKIHSPLAAAVAAWIGALYGPLFFHESIFIPESIGIPLYAAALYAALCLAEKPAIKRALIAGALFGLAALTKAGILLFAVVFAGYLILSKKAWKPALAALAAMAAVLAPITAHNLVRGRDFVLLTSHAGFNFYIGNNPDAEGVFMAPRGIGTNVEAQIEDSRAVAEAALGRPLKPSEVSKYWSDKAKAFIAANPGRFLWLCGRKMLLFFDAREISDIEDYAFLARFVPALRFPWINFAFLGPFVILGLFILPKKIRHAPVIYLWIFAYLAGIVTFFINARYRLPMLPVFFAVAGAAIAETASRVRGQKMGQTALCAAILAAGVGVTQLKLVGTDHIRDLVNIGDIYLQMDQNERAIDFYREALEVEPRDPKANLALGIALTKTGRDEEAEDHYRISLAANPDNAQAVNNMGLVYDKQGRFEEAEKAFEKAIRLRPNFSQAYNNLGMTYGKKGENEKARSALEKSIEINPSSAKAYTKLGLIYHRLGRDEEAVRSWQKALEIDPSFPDAQRALEIARRSR